MQCGVHGVHVHALCACRVRAECVQSVQCVRVHSWTAHTAFLFDEAGQVLVAAGWSEGARHAYEHRRAVAERLDTRVHSLRGTLGYSRAHLGYSLNTYG